MEWDKSMKNFHLHLVSDSTGETVSSVARAALAQFEGIEHEEHIWSLVRTPGQLEPLTKIYYDQFRRCAGCGQVYWSGSHFEKLQKRIETIRARLTNDETV